MILASARSRASSGPRIAGVGGPVGQTGVGVRTCHKDPTLRIDVPSCRAVDAAVGRQRIVGAVDTATLIDPRVGGSTGQPPIWIC